MVTMLNEWRAALGWRGALSLATMVSCLALLGLQLRTALPVNAWSVAYAILAMKGQPGLEVLPGPPKGHMRAPIWLAQEAVAQGSPQRALDLVAGLPESDLRDVLRIQGEAFFALGDDGKAVDAWERAGDYQSLAKAGSVAESKGAFDTAELAYRAGWKINPEMGTLPLANFLWHARGGPVAAEQVLRSSLSRYDPHNLNWLRSLGLVLQAQSRWDEAIAVYQEALNESPHDLYSLYLIGLAYVSGKNDTARAQSIFEKMILLAPTKGDGYFAMGLLAAKQGEFDKADTWFIQAIARNPDNPEWWVVRGNTARDAMNVPFSLDIYNKAVQRFPDYALLYYEMARAYQLDNDRDLAINAIEKAQGYQTRPNAWYFVRAGKIYEWAGERAQARSEYLGALSVDPGNLSAHQAAEQYLLRLDSVGD